MFSEHDLREQLAAYVAREISLASLERWLNAASPLPLVVDNSDAAFRLLASVNLLVSERHDNIIGADDLREELSVLLNNVDLVVDIGHASPFEGLVKKIGFGSLNLSPVPVVLR